ncbi:MULTISPECIES: class I SAM-dependent methyltransferase [unclassified Pseudomonas]|uniref:class I SAM-dependent methyltransferase n=1 Tax=unclassified Pseudomonas TaxID=196821 RepID=UPI002AC90353|nr:MULTISPECIES: class I SAM-dependent methyltransferase [unclassified Pseudomonas]MEB0041382.1 class I SAM-dependent methyltransferase [Pseudomonas sp. MH10]MEB0121203.1 class I SAM-dependent methyltransferase [Pseudomonas sp. CCI1.2]WPX64251.1 class I SAM-dependent methyltransferase [Pseudomonas sp. MH10]
MRTCPVCSTRFPNFLPLPASYFEIFNRLNAAYSLDDFETLNLGQYGCPNCAASDRDRLYALFVNQILGRSNDSPMRILDIAPAPVLSKFLRALPNVEYRSADLFSPLADDTVDIMDMYIYPDNAFDFIVCSHVLEHVPNDALAIAELYRVLSPGGIAILMVPILLTATETDEDPLVTDVNERWTRFCQDDHVRLYAKNDFLNRLKTGGFHVISLASGAFGSGTFTEHGITEKSVLLHVGQKM